MASDQEELAARANSLPVGISTTVDVYSDTFRPDAPLYSPRPSKLSDLGTVPPGTGFGMSFAFLMVVEGKHCAED